MIGRTSQDPLGLWKIPLKALQKAGVNTSYVKKVSFKQAKEKYPGIALIPVDRRGKNQIYVLPGVNQDFGKKDVDQAGRLFTNPLNNKVMVLALEIPLAIARYCIDKAYQNNIKVVLDPGGISGSIRTLLNRKVFLLKPNEHEAKLITGITINNLASARKAARKIMQYGVQNIMITHGARGAYLVTPDSGKQIKVPRVKRGKIRDETGCGDQVTALIGACLAEGQSLEVAAHWAVKGGTLQFHRSGIQPVTRKALLER
jgi:ribokinase